MTAARLLKLFDRVADAPDAVTRLRRLVLTLAFTGRLVPASSEHGSARTELEELARARATAPAKSRPRRAAQSVSSQPSVRKPRHRWEEVSLGEIVRVVNGRAYAQHELLSTGTPVLRVGNLFTSNVWYYSNLELDDDKYCEEGDLIFAWSASFGPFIWRGPRVIYHYHIWKLVPYGPEADRTYLHRYLLYKTAEIKEAGHGISMVHMTKEKMERLAVPFPPREEQERIVTRVDELMALCDRLEAAQKEREAARRRVREVAARSLGSRTAGGATAPPNAFSSMTRKPEDVSTLRVSILRLAVQGRLLPNSRRVPADEDSPFDVPEGWKWSKLSALGKFKGGATPSKSNPDYWTGSIPWVSPKDMKVDHLRDAKLHITEEAIGGSATTLIEPPSLVFVVRGMILGHSFPVAITQVPLTINQDMKALVLADPAMADYLLIALKALKPEMLARVKRSTHGTGRIEGSEYRDFPVPIPPATEQHCIVAKVNELMALCDQLEAHLRAGDVARSKLLDALIAEALADPETK